MAKMEYFTQGSGTFTANYENSSGYCSLISSFLEFIFYFSIKYNISTLLCVFYYLYISFCSVFGRIFLSTCNLCPLLKIRPWDLPEQGNQGETVLFSSLIAFSLSKKKKCVHGFGVLRDHFIILLLFGCE